MIQICASCGHETTCINCGLGRKKQIFKEKIKLNDNQLLSIIRGKRIIFSYIDYYDIEIIPPNNGISLTYDEWKELLSKFMPISPESFELINKIQSKFKGE